MKFSLFQHILLLLCALPLCLLLRGQGWDEWEPGEGEYECAKYGKGVID